MKSFKTVGKPDFSVLHATATSQAAMMTIEPGDETSEGSHNEHAWSEQWLYVVSGTGDARDPTRKRKPIKLAVGALLLIEKGDAHTIVNTGTVPLVTLNIYAPPAYDGDGEPLYGGTPDA